MPGRDGEQPVGLGRDRSRAWPGTWWWRRPTDTTSPASSRTRARIEPRRSRPRCRAGGGRRCTSRNASSIDSCSTSGVTDSKMAITSRLFSEYRSKRGEHERGPTGTHAAPGPSASRSARRTGGLRSSRPPPHRGHRARRRSRAGRAAPDRRAARPTRRTRRDRRAGSRRRGGRIRMRAVGPTRFRSRHCVPLASNRASCR